MKSQSARNQGFAVVVVLLVSMVALGAIVTTASLSSLSARQVAGDERQSTIALFAAESALNTVLARSRTAAYAYDEDIHASVSDWLAAVDLDAYTLPSGATVTLAALNEAGGRVTLRAVGTAPNGATRTVFQDFVLDATALDPTLFADAALLTKDALATNSQNSRLVGLDLLEDSWKFTAVLGNARDGDYVEIAGVRYEVSGRAENGSATLTTVDGATVLEPDPTPGTTVVDLIPFALTQSYGSTTDPMTLSVTNTDLYQATTADKTGTFIAVGDGAGTVTAVDHDVKTITVDWDAGTFPDSLEEGSPVRKVVPSAIAEGGCPSESADKLDDKLPQGCYEEDLGDLWANTFAGSSKTELREMAIDAGTYYTDGAWPESVSGLTWVDAAKTQGKNNELCGDGIVVLNTGSALDEPTTKINLTTTDCDFTGVLYIIGQLTLVGNLDNFSGAIVVEGPGVTTVQGTGEKALYDPVAIRNALDSLPPITVDNGLFATVPNSVRFGR